MRVKTKNLEYIKVDKLDELLEYINVEYYQYHQKKDGITSETSQHKAV
jgi:hypothetical protein